MKEFSLEWLNDIRKAELISIEMELNTINATISEKESEKNKLKEEILILRDSFKTFKFSWQISLASKTIADYTERISVIDNKLTYLYKEKDMIVTRFLDKENECKILKDMKKEHIKQEKRNEQKKEEKVINNLSLLNERKDV